MERFGGFRVKNKKAPIKRVNKKELAIMGVMYSSGESLRSIGRTLSRNHKTIAHHLKSSKMNDPEVKELISVLKVREADDLVLLCGKARMRLHELLDGGKTKVIETTAVMDRSFQQRRLLEGASTHNIKTHQVVVMLEEQQKRIEEELDELRQLKDKRSKKRED